MIESIIRELREYFNSLENPNKEQQHLKNRLNADFFPITSVSRYDLIGYGYNVSKIDDDSMYKLARKMANDYTAQMFHLSMDIIAGEILNFPKSNESKILEDEEP